MVTGGCASSPTELEYHYVDDPNQMQLGALKAGGNFALFYAGHDAPEVPVRVVAGDTVGFLRGTDGRLKAVAGAFVMDVDPEVHAAVWRRLTSDDDGASGGEE